MIPIHNMSGDIGAVFTCLVIILTIGAPVHAALAQCSEPLGFANEVWGIQYNDKYYHEVDLLTQHQITGFSFHSLLSGNVTLFYSQEGVIWDRYISSDERDTLEGNTDSTSIMTFNLTPPVQARYVAISPAGWFGYLGYLGYLEFYGCEADKPITVNYTVVTKDIKDSQEWSLSQSPFVVASMITIQNTGHIKVQAGVKILFGSHGGLQVSGTLEVNGLSGNMVVFSSPSSEFHHPDRWLGIKVLDQGNLTLEHCDIHWATTGIKGPLSSITVRHCHIHHNEIGLDLSMGDTDPGRTQIVGTQVTDNSKQGIKGEGRVDGRNFMGLKDCEFSNSGEHAFFLSHGATVVKVENSVFSHNDYGTYIVGSDVDLSMKNCTYKNNTYGLHYRSDAAFRFSITVDRSRFESNTHGIRLNVENVAEKSKISITNCFLSNIERSVYLYGQYQHETSILLRNNTVASTFKETYYPVWINCYGNHNISVTVENNFFNSTLHLQGRNEVAYLLLNNTFNSLEGEIGLRIDGGNVNILNNIFHNCTTHSVIYTQVVNTVISGNSFQNPKAQYDVTTTTAFTEDSRLNASYNYWGRNDKFYVRSRISDFFYDLNHAIVDVHPFYKTDDLTELSIELDSGLFAFQGADTIGGMLTESVTLSPNQYLFVTRSLYIPESYTLTILQNVTLVFPFKQGVFVKGVLEIHGEKNGPVVLTNQRTDDIHWSGVIFNSTGSFIKNTLLKDSQTAIQVMTNSTGSIIITDSIITRCHTAVNGKLWANTQLSLHRVKVRETYIAVNLEKMSRDTLFIDFVHCEFDGKTYLHSFGKEGDLTVSIESTTFSGLFKIESCDSNINMNISNTIFIESHCPVCQDAIFVKGGPLHILIRNISVSGQTVLSTCSFTGDNPGTIDIRNSRFEQTENAHAFQIGTWVEYKKDAPHNILFVNNTLYSASDKGLYLGIYKYSSSWSIVAVGNTFNGAGIGCNGSISNASFDRNIFIHATTVLFTNIMCKENSTTTLTKNTVHGGTLTLYSERSDDTFDLQGNWFSGSEIILRNPRTVIHGNTFLRGSEFDINFKAQGYANKEINCTLNFWDTKDRKEIDKRLYDSSYDERLPTIIFVPFYEVKYNCSETLYEHGCFPYVNVLNVIPSSGPNAGGTRVHIRGHNFPGTNKDIYYCRFDRTVVNGTRLSREHVVCNTPRHPNGEVTVEISTDGHQFTHNKTKFTYYDACHPGICMENLTPPHGSCLYGDCLCFLPWSGKNCAIELKAPAISLLVPNQTVTEGVEYWLQPTLTQGNKPTEWFLREAPPGIEIDPRTGLISWERTVASGEPYKITIIAANRIGHSEIILSLTVPLSYNVTIDELIPSGPLPFPKSVQTKGHVSSLSGTSRPSVAFVDIKIRNKGRMTSRITASASLNTQNKFEAIYFPKVGDSGLFEVDGRHPSDSGFTAQRVWRVLGMKCVPGYTSRQAYLDTDVVEMLNVTVLRNVGVDTIRNITATVEGVGEPLTSAVVRVNKTLSNEKSKLLVETLEPGIESMIDLILTASTPLRGTIGVVFSTAEGTIARARVRIELNVRKPVLVTSPRLLHDNVPRGRQKIFQIYINNAGEVPATGLSVTLSSEPRLAISAFSSSRGQASERGLDLYPNETVILVLTFTAGFADPLGESSGSISLKSDLASASIPYRFYVTSLEKLNFTIRVEDEFTYFASDKPLVSGAVIVLKNPVKGYTEKRITNTSGLVVFENVLEDRYTLQATAPGHSSYSAVIIAKPSDSSFSVFLQRVAVTCTWTVTPTTFEDKYIIKIDSRFETDVPMPVVTVEPAIIDIIPYEERKKDVINFNITNHGLIRADNVRILIPQDHPTLFFTQTIDPIGPVDANTSIIVQVLVRAKTRVKRDLLGFKSCWKLLYDYFCGQTRTGGQDITLTRFQPGRPPIHCGGARGGIVDVDVVDHGFNNSEITTYPQVTGISQAPFISPSTTVIVYKPVTPLTCGCGKALIDCLLNLMGLPELAECAEEFYDVFEASGFKDTIVAGLKFGSSCFRNVLKKLKVTTVLRRILKKISVVFAIWDGVKCIYGLAHNCISNRQTRSTDSEAIQEMIDSNVHMYNFLIIIKEIYGGEDMFSLNDNSWMNSFNLGLAEDSVAGQFLSQSEITSIIAPLNTTLVPTVQKFLFRWNKTITAWEDGTLATLGPGDDVISYSVVMSRSEQFRKDTEIAKQRGFDSIFAAFDNAVKVFKAKQEKDSSGDGVCAKVRIRIVQELVLTRDAFDARLEIENGEKSALENIAVTVNIWPTIGNNTYTKNKFSVGNVTLVGITAVDGSGRLERDVSGTAEWLIIPYSTAAVEKDTLYNVGGTLSYTVDGSNFSIPLLPDTITVKPNPSLILNYFHEKYVQGDDPMTANVTEPVVPFTLAVMVSNGAYGVARQLKITSAQPEIIENEKGLLVSFKIIGAQLGTDPVTPSLSVNFGDIESFGTKTARWLLTSSFRGKFYNFTATFENINPLGDPQLSVMESVGYHQLIHLVRLESTGDDLDDFLVNDVPDADEMADGVYDSTDGFFSHVSSTTVNNFSLQKTETFRNKTYSYINLSVTVPDCGNSGSAYIYTRLVNNLTKDSISETLLGVTRDDNKKVLVGSNAWQTNYYHDKFYLHVFDFVDNLNTSNTVTYSLLFGSKNNQSPTNTSEITGVDTSIPAKTTEIPGVITAIPANTSEIPGVVTPIPAITSKIPGAVTRISANTSEIPGVTTHIPTSTNETPEVIWPRSGSPNVSPVTSILLGLCGMAAMLMMP